MGINWKKTAGVIKAGRERRHLTQDKLAAMIGVRWNTIARVEIGDRRPSIDLLEKIASVLGCRVRDLLQEEEPMPTATTKHEPSFLGAPSFFRAKVIDAQSRAVIATDPETGRVIYADYATVGHAFSGLLNSGDLSEDAFDELKTLCKRHVGPQEFAEELLNFILREFPGCMRLIPSRRRAQFMTGVVQGMASGKCDVESNNAERLVELYSEKQR